MKHMLIAALALSTGLACAQQCPQGAWEPGFRFGNDQSADSDAIEAMHLIHIFDGTEGRIVAIPRGENVPPPNHSCTTDNVRLWTPPPLTDPPTIPGTFAAIPNEDNNVFCSGHSQLADGRILTTGANFNECHIRADLFDPVSGLWNPTHWPHPGPPAGHEIALAEPPRFWYIGVGDDLIDHEMEAQS